MDSHDGTFHQPKRRSSAGTINAATSGNSMHDTVIFAWVAVQLGRPGFGPVFTKFGILCYVQCEKNARCSTYQDVYPCLPIIESSGRNEDHERHKEKDKTNHNHIFAFWFFVT